MQKLYLLLTIIILFNSATKGQSIKISGRLYGGEDVKIINGVIISLTPGSQISTTGPKGEYSFICPPGNKRISTQILGYKPAIIRFEANSDTVIDIYLEVSPVELSEVTVTSDSIKTLVITPLGSVVLTPASIRETPRLFSEPDLLKSFQFLPGVVAGKDGSSDIYVRGGSTGQNIILANGCYFFLPGHLLGIVSPYDLDFLETAEIYKDYFPSELGGGASSVINLDFKKSHSDSLRAQLRLGLISSGATIELPLNKINWSLTAGLKRANYSIYAPLLKKIVTSGIGDFLPPDNYSFYDGFLRVSHASSKWGNIDYLFFGNYDNGKEENKTNSQVGDTLIYYENGISQGWNNMVHALQWDFPVNGNLKWKFNLNYNRISIGRSIYMQTEKSLNETGIFESQRNSYLFSPVINSIGSTLMISRDYEKFNYSAGISNRFRSFSPDIISTNIINDTVIKNKFGETNKIIEPAAFLSSTILLTEKIQINAGLRLSGGMTRDAIFFVLEPRLRLTCNQGGSISPHINYVRLSQFDHSVEGSNAGLRTMLWVPVFKDLGPEISDVFSAGFQGQINNKFVWTLDGYYKKISGMVDFKPGASFIFDTAFVDMLDRINGKAYGLEIGIIKRIGKLTGSVGYTYSRSKREWGAPGGIIWIPSTADRPHNFNLSLKYYFKERTSFGLNWIYQSGVPATIYMHNTSYGEWFETKNNIRYFDYHRLDLSLRQIIYKRKFSILLDVDIYNVYNRQNTFYFQETYDESEKRYYFKNISLFPVMPSLTITIKY